MVEKWTGSLESKRVESVSILYDVVYGYLFLLLGSKGRLPSDIE